MATDFPSDLVDLQRRVHAAWDAVEAHRKAVNADRKATATPGAERHSQPVLRLWTEEEDARHAELMAAVREATDARRAALAGSGLGASYDVVQDLHAAAREV